MRPTEVGGSQATQFQQGCHGYTEPTEGSLHRTNRNVTTIQNQQGCHDYTEPTGVLSWQQRTCHSHTRAPEASLQPQHKTLQGPNTPNSVPDNLTNIMDQPADVFKRKLDKFLQSILNEPSCRGDAGLRTAKWPKFVGSAQDVSRLRHCRHTLHGKTKYKGQAKTTTVILMIAITPINWSRPQKARQPSSRDPVTRTVIK